LIPTPGPETTTSAEVASADRCQADDPFFDYLLLPYTPLRPAAGKLRAVSLLRESFALMGVAAEGDRLVAALHRHLGPFRTVWGIKAGSESAQLDWELYFYRRDTGRGEPAFDGVLNALEPCLRVAERPPLPDRWELWSLEFDAAALAAGHGGTVDVYLGMRAYRARGQSLELKNLYTFEDAGMRLERVLERLLIAVHAPRDGEEIARLLPPALLAGCPRVCVANKRLADGLYFSGLRLEQLRAFVAAHGWPPAIGEWLDQRADLLDHLLWDVGFDFRRVGPHLHVQRSGVFSFL
jgi:hypothetical protein